MNKPKHTPGPWKCSPLDRNNRFVVFQPNEHPAAAVRSTDEVLSNARLIAAAPELLEAAKWALTALEALGHGSANTDEARALENAIQKAIGSNQ